MTQKLTHTILVRAEDWLDRSYRETMTSRALRSAARGYQVLVMDEHSAVLETFDPPNTLEGWTKNIQDSN